LRRHARSRRRLHDEQESPDIAFELTPGTNGTWAETVLHSFDKTDGEGPKDLIFGAAGNLYGTTSAGGAHSGGTVFELTPAGGGTWTETVLYNFCVECESGEGPSGVVFDPAGNLYGTTISGGRPSTQGGVVFELTPGAGGAWTETVLYRFCHSSGCKDGTTPQASLTLDTAGNLYGTTYEGGDYRNHCSGGCGTVFELIAEAGGEWHERVLHSFGRGEDGAYSQASLIFDATGNLWGTTSSGGAYQKSCAASCGTVFQLKHGTGGAWPEKVSHSFGKGKDGGAPLAGLILDSAGNLYGTTSAGGVNESGTVFEITP
jgi:uncharacterized repeat protein (TIGR03803 family)